MAELPTYITLEEAARRYRIDPQVLAGMVESGKVRAVKVNRGIIAVAEGDVKLISRREELWERVRYLDGIPIGLEEACTKYQLSSPSLYRWISRGYVRVLQDQRRGGRGHKRTLNEADVAYIALVAKERGKVRGKRIVTQEFVPLHCSFSAA